jgi:uncharacterized protein YdiU (UPF0061 family)
MKLHRSGLAQLGSAFGSDVALIGLENARLVALSEPVASALGLSPATLREPQAVAALAGARLFDGSHPFASVYSGHQFGVWAGQLGDGRAQSLGVIERPSGPLELQLKGAGPTPYSRRADGRAVLRSSIREFLASEAMAGLGIPTTRALSIVTNDLPVIRETVEPAAVVCRVAPSFIRFGHFEHFYHRNLQKELRALADHVIDTHFPALEGPKRVEHFLLEVVSRTARLMAQWQAVGFGHGVMNTDNMSILGLTIDYGPYAFQDAFDPPWAFNHSDHQGRYSWQNQPKIGYWNCMCLAQTLVDLIGSTEAAQACLQTYPAAFEAASQAAWMNKLGLDPERSELREAADRCIQELLASMRASRADFTMTFRLLTEALINADERIAPPALRNLFLDREGFDGWYRGWMELVGSADSLTQAAHRARAANPRVVLRNHMAQNAIVACEQGNHAEVQRLLEMLRNPFEAPLATEDDLALPPDWASRLEISCSS